MITRVLPRTAVLLALALASGCDLASANDNEVLPGHSRPVLQHDWPHPRDLGSGASEFRPPDAAAALVTLPNGLRTFIIPDSADNIVQVVAVLPLGALRERADEAGAANALANVLVDRLQANLPPDVLTRVATDRSTSALRLTLQTMPADWRTALAALGRVLMQPVSAMSAGAEGGGGRGGGRGGGSGAVAELQRATAMSAGEARARPDAVRSLAERSVTPHTVVLAVAGAVAREDAESALRETVGSWTSPNVAAEPARGAAALARRTVTDPLVLVDQPATQASVALGHPMRAVEAADEPALAVLAEVLNIRLNIATREKRGLTNRASIDLPHTRLDAGMLVVRAASRPESAAPILHFALDELARIRIASGAPAEAELEQVKGGLTLGSWQASLDGARAVSSTYALELVRWGTLDRLDGWPSAVRAVTAEQVVDIARKYIEPDLMTAAVTGPLEMIERSRHPRWPLTLDALRLRLREP